MDPASQPGTGRSPGWDAASRASTSSVAPSPASASWDALTAWRLQETYAPVAAAVRTVLSCVDTSASQAVPRLRVLLIGGQPAILAQFLADGSPVERDPSAVEFLTQLSIDGRLLMPDGHVDCAVAIDWLPSLAPSVRGTAVAELCRVSRSGVVLMHLSDSDESRHAARAANDLHRLVRGGDHRSLGRALEMGLPDPGIVRGRLAERLPCIETCGVSSPEVWLSAESLAMSMSSADREPTEADASAAAAYPSAGFVADGGFRTLFVATARPPVRPLPPPTSLSGRYAFGLHQAVEAAAQRRALETLTAAVTHERATEREEFRAAIASLAVEIRELEGRTEALSRDVRERDQIIANQQAIVSAEAARAAAFQTAAADAERRAALHHGQWMESERLRRASDERVEGISAQVQQLEARLSAAQPLADAHVRFVQSRAGHALRLYSRLKQRILGR